MDDEYDDFQSSYESGLEGEFDSEDPPEGYESWAEWYYYNGESDRKKHSRYSDEQEENNNYYQSEKIMEVEEEAIRQLNERAKREGVHPEMYYRTDGWCPKWIQNFNTWFYKRPALYNRMKIIITIWSIIAVILMVLLTW